MDNIKDLVIGSHSKISKFTFNDKDIVESFILRNELKHTSSWLYTIRNATNDDGQLGYRYYHSGLYFTLAYRKNSLYIGNAFGVNSTNIKNYIDFLLTIRRVYKRDIILKNSDETILLALKQKNIKVNTYKNSDHSSILLEDMCYPDKKLNLHNLIEIKRDHTYVKNKKFRKGVNRFSNNKFSVQEIDVLDIKHLYSIEYLIESLRYLSGKNSSKFNAYLNMVNYLYFSNESNLSDRYIFKLYTISNKVQGMYILEKLDPSTIGFYCGLTSKMWGGITEYFDYLIFSELYRKNINTVLLGGSETKGVYKYVEKLLPLDNSTTTAPAILR